MYFYHLILKFSKMKYKICCKENTSLILEPNPKHLKQVKLSVVSYNRRNSILAYTCLWFRKTFFFFCKNSFCWKSYRDCNVIRRKQRKIYLFDARKLFAILKKVEALFCGWKSLYLLFLSLFIYLYYYINGSTSL